MPIISVYIPLNKYKPKTKRISVFGKAINIHIQFQYGFAIDRINIRLISHKEAFLEFRGGLINNYFSLVYIYEALQFILKQKISHNDNINRTVRNLIGHFKEGGGDGQSIKLIRTAYERGDTLITRLIYTHNTSQHMAYL